MTGLLNANEHKPLEGGPSFSFFHRVFRAIWWAVWLLLASWTPAPLHRWRVLLLRCFGARVHWSARVYGSARIWFPPNLHMDAHAVLGPQVNCYCMDIIHIGEKVIISQGTHLCAGTHDITDADFQLITKPIIIERGTWVAAEAFIGPGVIIKEYAVIGARAVVFRNADAFSIYVGNPAEFIKKRVFKGNDITCY